MKIDISPKDMWYLRDAIHHAVWLADNPPEDTSHPASGTSNPELSEKSRVLRKFNRKLNRALKKAYGHDCSGAYYYY